MHIRPKLKRVKPAVICPRKKKSGKIPAGICPRNSNQFICGCTPGRRLAGSSLRRLARWLAGVSRKAKRPTSKIEQKTLGKSTFCDNAAGFIVFCVQRRTSYLSVKHRGEYVGGTSFRQYPRGKFPAPFQPILPGWPRGSMPGRRLAGSRRLTGRLIGVSRKARHPTTPKKSHTHTSSRNICISAKHVYFVAGLTSFVLEAPQFYSGGSPMLFWGLPSFLRGNGKNGSEMDAGMERLGVIH